MYCIIFHIHYTASFCIKVFYIVLYYIVSCYIVLHDWAAVGIRKAPIMDPASYWISSWSPGTNERQPGSPWEFTVVEQFEGDSLCNLYMTIRIWRVSRICWLRLCVCAHQFVQYFRWKRSSKMQESPHSVLILATLLLCSEWSFNHSIGIIGSLSGKKNWGIFLENLKLQ